MAGQAHADGRREGRRVGARRPQVGGSLLDAGEDAGEGAGDPGGDRPVQLAPHEEVTSGQHGEHAHEHEHDGAAVGAGRGSARLQHRVVVGHACVVYRCIGVSVRLALGWLHAWLVGTRQRFLWPSLVLGAARGMA